MRYYAWILTAIDHGDIIDEGVFYAKSDRAAKGQVSKISGRNDWHGTWKEDKMNGGWNRYNGDSRLNPIYHSSGANVPTHRLYLRRSKEA